LPRDYKSKFGLLNRSRDDLNFHPDERVLSAQLTHLEAILTASARATKSIDGRLFADRVNQLDLRLSKGVQFERYRVEVLADFYNAFNTSPELHDGVWARVVDTGVDPAVRVREVRCTTHLLIERPVRGC